MNRAVPALASSLRIGRTHMPARPQDPHAGLSKRERAAAVRQPPSPCCDSPTRDQAAVFTFSIATAKRFEIGCAASPASLIIASVFFDVSATIESNELRT